MKLAERIKTYNFWVSLSSAIFLIIKVLGTQIGFNVDESLFSDLITSICSILVILGIIVPPKYPETKLKTETVSQNDNISNVNDNQNIENLSTETTEQNKTIDKIESTNNSIICNDENKDNVIVDVDLDSANINIDNIDNNIEVIDNFNFQKNNLRDELKSQAKLFENNIDEYIKILEDELNNFKSK